MLGIIVPQINLLSHRSINLRYKDRKHIGVFPLPFLFLKQLHEWKCILHLCIGSAKMIVQFGGVIIIWLLFKGVSQGEIFLWWSAGISKKCNAHLNASISFFETANFYFYFYLVIPLSIMGKFFKNKNWCRSLYSVKPCCCFSSVATGHHYKVSSFSAK